MKPLTESSLEPRRLSTTLAAAFFFLSVVVLLLYVGLETFSEFKSQEVVLSSRQQLIAQDVAKMVRNFINENFSILETAARVTNLEARPEAEQNQILQRLLGVGSALRQMVLLDAENRILAQSSRLSMNGSKHFTDRLKGFMPGRERQDKRMIGPVTIDHFTNEPMVMAAVPVTNVFGDFKGTLIAELSLKSMWDIVDQITVGETGYAYVSDRKGNLLAFEDTGRVLKGENVSYVKAVTDFMQNQGSSMPNKVIRYPGIRGSTVVGTYTPLKTPDWAVITEIPWKEAYREALQEVVRAVGIMLALAISAGIFGMFMARRLAAPVINLTETATRIAAGEEGLQAAVSGPKELAQLAAAFNSMTARLRQSLKKSEKQFADLKRSESALRLSEERLSLALEGTSDGIWDWNPQTEEVYFSPRYYTMLGYEPDEFPPSYESWRELLHPDDARTAEQTVQQAIEEHSPFAIEFRLRAKDGTWRWVLGRGKVVELDSEGKAVRVAGSHADIAERKATEKELQKTTRLLKETQAITKLGGWEYDVAAKCLTWTDEVYRIYGVDRDFDPNNISRAISFYAPEHAPVLEGAFRKAVELGEPYDLELPFIRANGEHIWVRTMGRPVMENGHVVRVGGNIMDITERLQAEHGLRNALRSLKNSQKLAKVGSWDWDIKTGEIEWSDEVYRIFGLDPKKFHPQIDSVMRLFHPEDRKLHESIIAQAISNHETYSFESRILLADGRIRFLVSTSEGQFDNNGDLMQIFGTVQDITERKEAEVRIRESEERYRLLFDNSEVLVSVYDREGICRLMNRKVAALFGGVPEDFIGKSFQELHPEGGEEYIRRIHETIDSGIPHVYDDEVTFPQGNRWLLTQIQPVPDAEGVFRTGQVISQDITERKEAEEAFRASEEMYRRLAENSPFMIYRMLLPDGKYEYVSPAAEAIFGFPPEKFYENPLLIREIIHPDWYGYFEIEWGKLLKGYVSPTYEYQIVHKDGSVRWINQRNVVLRNQAGNVVAIEGIVMDITERKHAEEALRKYERIVSTSQDMMALVNTNYVYEAVNESLLRSLDMRREEVLGKTVAEVMGEGVFREKIQPWMDMALFGQTVRHWDTFDNPSDGPRILEATNFPMMDKNRRVEGVVLNVRDMTETRRLQEQLMQSQKIESLGTLAGGVAHEINNPINGIMNYAQLIIDRAEKGSPALALADEIIHETRRIATIVQNLLTFARHEKQSHSPAYLSDIVSSVLSLIQTVMRHDQVDLQVDIPGDLPQFKCRSQQIQQVLMNLLTNARDALNERYPNYSPEKQLRISAQLVGKEDGKYVRTTVEDRGAGISPKVMGRIFDPFFTTKPKEVGTGLGLSISYGIVRDHGGELSVESEPGQYARFHMDLPLDNGWMLT